MRSFAGRDLSQTTRKTAATADKESDFLVVRSGGTIKLRGDGCNGEWVSLGGDVTDCGEDDIGVLTWTPAQVLPPECETNGVI